MQNQLECYSNRHGNSNYYDLEFSKRVNTHNHPLLTGKIEQVSSMLKNDHLKFILDDKGNISILRLEIDKYVLINNNEIDKNAAKLIKSISKIAKKMDIASLKKEHFKPVYEAQIHTYCSFGSVKPVSEPSFSINNCIKNFRKLFATQLVIKSLVRKTIEKNFKNKSPEQIAQMYVNNEQLFSSIKEKIIKNNFSAFDTFQSEELETLINNIFLDSYKERLNEPTSKDIFKARVYHLDVARIITRMQHHNVSKNEYKKLLSISPLDIPIEELAKISVTPENEKLLSQIWGHLIGNLFANGNLGKLYSGNKEHQAKYASAYMEARSKLPFLLQNKLVKLTNELDGKESIKNITHFTFINSDISLLKNRLPSSDEIDLYNRKIKPGIDWIVNNSIQSDAAKVIERLVYRGEVTNLAVHAYNFLSPEERLIFSFDDIMNLFFISLEKTAVEEYHISEAQLDNFRKGRESPLDEKPDYVYNESCLDSLKYKHDANTIKTFKDLLFVSKVLDTSWEDVSQGDKIRFENTLILILNDKKISKLLGKYLPNEKSDNFDSFLTYTPKFFHPLFKKMLSTDTSVQKVPYGISLEALKFVSNYVKTVESVNKSSDSTAKTLEKAKKLLIKFQSSPDSITKNEKLTVKELGALSKISRYAKSLEDLIDLDLNFEKSPETKSALDLIKNSKEIIKQIETIIAPEVLHHYRSGDLLAYNSAKKKKWHNHSPPLEERLTAFVSDGLTHGGKLFRKDDKILVSHLLGGVTTNKLDLYTLCISDIYEININPLFSTGMQSVLKERYGNQWNLHVNKLYVDAETKLHSKAKKKFDDIENDQKKRVFSALANFPRIAKFFIPDPEITGHKKEFESSRYGVYDAFFGEGPKDKTQICSEWASKATLAAMMEANMILAADLAEKTGFRGKALLEKFDEHKLILPGDVRQYLKGFRHWGKDRFKTIEAEKKLIKILKENNYTPIEIELIIRIGNKEIFNIPYDRRERLKNIHPGRMVKLLDDKNCLRKRELPTGLTQLVEVG